MDGTFATQVQVPVGNLYPKPAGLDWNQSAALPLGRPHRLQGSVHPRRCQKRHEHLDHRSRRGCCFIGRSVQCCQRSACLGDLLFRQQNRKRPSSWGLGVAKITIMKTGLSRWQIEREHSMSSSIAQVEKDITH